MAEGKHVPYGQRLLPQVLDAAAKREPSRIFGGYPISSDLASGLKYLTVGDLAGAVNYMAYWIEGKIGKSQNFEVIAYIGLNDFRYWVMELAAMKCGYPILVPSLRNSDTNNISLFSVANCKRVFFAQPLQGKVANLGVEAFCIPSMDEIFTSESPAYPYTKSWEEARSDPVAICHTSGSTGAPKPVAYTNSFLGTADAARNLPAPSGRRDGNISLLDGTTNFFGFPNFHLMGLYYGLAQLFYRSVAILPSPDIPATGKHIVDIMGHAELHSIVSPPVLLDEIVKYHQDTFAKRSHSLTIIHNAGGPLAKPSGDYLSQRVDIVQIIGSTETAKLPNLVARRENWMWYEWNPLIGGVYMDKVEETTDLYELTIRRKAGQEWAQQVFYAFPDLDEWRTRDIFRKHPTEDLFLYEGRVDDVIVLNNGEKFNPVITEQTISSHPLVTGALVVGNKYDHLGLILESGEPEEGFIEKVWPTIEKANKEAPGHARVYKHMVIRTKSDKPLPRAGKGTIQRTASEKVYADEIVQLFARKTPSSRVLGNLPKIKLPRHTIEEFVRDAVAYQLQGEEFSGSDDLYFLGFDSLRTTMLAKTLSDNLGALLPAESAEAISPRLVYDNPSVEMITRVLHAIMNPELSRDGAKLYDVERMAFDKVKDLVKKYASNLPKSLVNGVQSENNGRLLHVAVTGTTGFLGYYLLLVLLQDPAVGRITCLNRSPTAREKFVEEYSASHKSRRPDISKIDFLKGSFGEKYFGLESAVYDDLVSEVDAVIHNAWKVDFNQNLSSFENPHLIGVRTLIEWALSSPRKMQISFVSSISTVAHWPGYFPGESGARANRAAGAPKKTPGTQNVETAQLTVPESSPDMTRIPARQLGYAQSKYTAEAILTSVSSTHDVPVTILRPGQIANALHTPGPVGHRSEWFPLLLMTSKSLRLLPRTATRTGEIDFMAADLLARVIGDIVIEGRSNSSTRKTGDVGVFNLVTPRSVPFVELIPAIKEYFAEIDVEDMKVVSLQEWVQALEQFDQNDEEQVIKYPALKLLGFFQGLAADLEGDETAGGAQKLRIETTGAARVSETMRDMRAVEGKDVVAWLQGWKI